ncbi:MAG: FAD-dependent oxidoreductase, partial [Victivallales bacterium]|nr:FAD-dependent oxidoreductase [Victivallales bacterium]
MHYELKYDILIIDAGSGGIGAAVGAARLGAKTLLIDRAPSPGG